MTETFQAHHEIFEQADTWEQTLDTLLSNQAHLEKAYSDWHPSSITLVGCGSSYYVSLSVAAVLQRRLGIPARAIVAGELVRHVDQYEPVLKDSLLISLSRSGRTTETLHAVERIQKGMRLPLLSILSTPDTPLDNLGDLSIALPWSHEKSVCQTRTISNLYLTGVFLSACWGKDLSLLDELRRAPAAARAFLSGDTWQPWLSGRWKQAVVLGDGELYGLACTNALTLVEMAETPANAYHTLDVRHGPTVLIDSATLVVLFSSREESKWEEELVADLHACGAKVLVVSAAPLPGVQGIAFGDDVSDAAFGLLASLAPQALAYHEAVRKGINPDQPRGLTPWIDLAK